MLINKHVRRTLNTVRPAVEAYELLGLDLMEHEEEQYSLFLS